MELPGTSSIRELTERAYALSTWKTKLARGVLPRLDEQEWPQEPFRATFLQALRNLEMPRFCRRHPQLLDSLLKNMLELVHEFEGKLQEQQEQHAQQSGEGSPSPQQTRGDSQPQDDNQDGEAGGQQSPDMDAEQMEEALQQAGQQGKQGEKKDIQISMEASEGGLNPEQQQQEGDAEAAEEAAAQLAKELVDKFEEQWKPALDGVEAAQQTFDNLEDLMNGPDGFDLSHSVWKKTGWQEVDELRKKLQNLREIRDLVRSLGRGGGKGPLRRAPEEVWASKRRPGVIRSPLQPEETRGLTRSGDLSRMLPFEAHLLAAGWPKQPNPDGSPKEGSRPARLLHMVRRAERGLMSYERTGWLEDEPARRTGRTEIRPAAEAGPIIVCLDTSGSMAGTRETVAKAVALECMRGAHRQQRACYLYAFSGPGDVNELELKVDASSLNELLDFLSGSFGGGTDVDRPLELSLQRLGEKDWELADILMVTDGEICPPRQPLLDQLARARADKGLEVHGLLVGRNDTSPVMESICSHLHVFKSWNEVGGSRNDYRW
ncbi:hypothetical protein WJX72_001579 [[Myrmecia] bisecta]|uniref:VWFA domain-containing protein n=1 Tax=[Myrmecia] bisecta TaxID=41462 RepID=A0AAW1QE71_9CHLO